jgi:hypothetical protein
MSDSHRIVEKVKLGEARFGEFDQPALSGPIHPAETTPRNQLPATLNRVSNTPMRFARKTGKCGANR